MIGNGTMIMIGSCRLDSFNLIGLVQLAEMCPWIQGGMRSPMYQFLIPHCTTLHFTAQMRDLWLSFINVTLDRISPAEHLTPLLLTLKQTIMKQNKWEGNKWEQMGTNSK